MSAPLKFRKRPLVIEAIKFFDLDSYQSIVNWYNRVHPGAPGASEVFRHVVPNMTIKAFEGTLTINPGDWIIRDVNGEFYPCKADVFSRTYEPVE